MRVYANWVQSLFAEARAELGENVSPVAVRLKAEDVLCERHGSEWQHLASGRSETFPSELTEQHAREWEDFERLCPIRPDGRTNMVLVKAI